MYWPKNCIKNLDGFGANETYHTIWSKNPFPFSTLRKKTSLPSNDLSACDWVERLLPPFCHLFLMVSMSPLLAFQQLLSYQNFAASRKGWWESAKKTRWWNQPWWFLSLRGSLANCFHSPQSCTIIYNRRSSASFQSAQNSVHITLLETHHTESLRIWIFMPKIIIFCWIFLNCIVDFWRENSNIFIL